MFFSLLVKGVLAAITFNVTSSSICALITRENNSSYCDVPMACEFSPSDKESSSKRDSVPIYSSEEYGFRCLCLISSIILPSSVPQTKLFSSQRISSEYVNDTSCSFLFSVTAEQSFICFDLRTIFRSKPTIENTG